MGEQGAYNTVLRYFELMLHAREENDDGCLEQLYEEFRAFIGNEYPKGAGVTEKYLNIGQGILRKDPHRIGKAREMLEK
jgi:hypothetical protein